MGQKKPEREQTEETKQSRWGFHGKTVWDWLPIVGALLVPLVIALGTGWITRQLANLENQRAQQAQKVENQRAEAERELAEQRAQDEALQAYLDQMSGLLLEKDLRTSEEDSEVRTLARARALTVLERLDPSRKTAVVQFLVEAKLVQRVVGTGPIISLNGADLSGAYLFSSALSGADLERADLGQANLSDADLSWADLREADLDGARGVTNRELEQQASLLSSKPVCFLGPQCPTARSTRTGSRARTRRRTRRATVLPGLPEPRGWLLSANNLYSEEARIGP